MSAILELNRSIGPANMEVREPSRREMLVAKMRQATEEQYRDLLTQVVGDETFDNVELLRLAAAMGRNDEQLKQDIEDRQAELEDQQERQRVHDEIHRLNKEIAQNQKKLNRLTTEQSATARLWKEADELVKRIEAGVAQKEKAARLRLLEANQAATAMAQTTTATIAELQSQLADIRPVANHVEQLQQARFRAEHLKAKKNSDDAMGRFVELQSMNEIPLNMVSQFVAPQVTGDVRDQLTAEKLADETTKRPRVRLGVKDGEPVEIIPNSVG